MPMGASNLLSEQTMYGRIMSWVFRQGLNLRHVVGARKAQHLAAEQAIVLAACRRAPIQLADWRFSQLARPSEGSRR